MYYLLPGRCTSLTVTHEDTNHTLHRLIGSLEQCRDLHPHSAAGQVNTAGITLLLGGGVSLIPPRCIKALDFVSEMFFSSLKLIKILAVLQNLKIYEQGNI